ncbi:MAG: hypothetical protein KDE19_23845, partial [Caldilineaceae bacterium]|nr:hypothetical protein [Caldilineaceae bacterium]
MRHPNKTILPLLLFLSLAGIGLFAIGRSMIPQANAATLDENGDLIIYDDALTSGWLNWSWAATNMAYTNTTHSGVKAIRTDLDGWGAFSPFFSNNQDWNSPTYTGLDTHGFDRLSFWVHRGESAGGQVVNVRAGDILPGWEWMHIAAFTVPTDNEWHQIILPLRELDGVDTHLARLSWNGNGSSTMPILLDDIKLLRETTPTTITRDPIDNNNTANQLWLYRDQRNAVMRSSWNAEIIHQSPLAASGAFGLGARFTYYGGVAFRPLNYTDQTPTTFALQNHNVLRFLINRDAGDAPGQRYEIYGLDAANSATRRTAVDAFLSSGVFDEDINTWQLATVPLSALQPADGPATPLYGVAIRENSGVQATTGFIYLDEIRFETVPTSADITIYDDALATDWHDDSWATVTNLAFTETVQSGTAAIAITHTAQWGGMHFATDNAI